MLGTIQRWLLCSSVGALDGALRESSTSAEWWLVAETPIAAATVRGSSTASGASATGQAGLQAAVWTRLLMLMPLLPLVYADREPKPELNLRTTLVRTLVRWLPLSHKGNPSTALSVRVPLMRRNSNAIAWCLA